MPEGTASLSFHYMLLRFTGKHDKKNTSVYRVLTSYDVWQKRLISRIRLKMRFMTFTVSFSTIDLVNTFCFGLGKCDCNKKMSRPMKMHEKHTTQKKHRKTSGSMLHIIDEIFVKRKLTSCKRKTNILSFLEWSHICKFIRITLELFELHVLYHISLFFMQHGIGSISARLVLHMFDDYKFLLVCFWIVISFNHICICLCS